MHPITQDEAKEALADIDQVARQTRRAVAGGPMGTNLLLWGIIWIIGFILSYLFPGHTGRIWWVLTSLGLGGTVLAGFHHHRRGIVHSEQALKVLGQISLFWLAAITYALTLGFLIRVSHWVDQLALIVCIMMLAYVVMGIWLRSPLLSVIGLVITVATLVGRVCVPPQAFLLWMAVFGGGGLFLPGLYLKLRWK
jgi:hypothetical protein